MRLLKKSRPQVVPVSRANSGHLPVGDAARMFAGCLVVIVGLSACGTEYDHVTPAAEAAPIAEQSVSAGSENVPVESATKALASTPVEKPATDPVATATVQPLKSDLVKVAASPASQPVEGSVAQSSPATLNSLAEIENDMALRNEGALLNLDPAVYSWAGGPGLVSMGNNPRGTNTPSWFQPTDRTLLSADYWRAVIPWFVIFEGVGNQATNTRIQLRNFKLHYKSKRDGQWRMLGSDNQFWGMYCTQDSAFAGCGGATADQRMEPDGGVSFRPIRGWAYHGWWTRGHVSIQPEDIAALFVTGQVRLVRDNASAADDRAKAKYLMHVGADYYPYPDYNFGGQVNPGVGISRSKYATSEWRPISFMTFSDVGTQWPGGGITRAEFNATPPPLE